MARFLTSLPTEMSRPTLVDAGQQQQQFSRWSDATALEWQCVAWPTGAPGWKLPANQGSWGIWGIPTLGNHDFLGMQVVENHRFYHFLDKGAHPRRYTYIYIYRSRYISQLYFFYRDTYHTYINTCHIYLDTYDSSYKAPLRKKIIRTVLEEELPSLGWLTPSFSGLTAGSGSEGRRAEGLNQKTPWILIGDQEMTINGYV